MPRHSDCVACASLDVPGDQLCALHKEAEYLRDALESIVVRLSGLQGTLDHARWVLAQLEN